MCAALLLLAASATAMAQAGNPVPRFEDTFRAQFWTAMGAWQPGATDMMDTLGAAELDALPCDDLNLMMSHLTKEAEATLFTWGVETRHTVFVMRDEGFSAEAVLAARAGTPLKVDAARQADFDGYSRELVEQGRSIKDIRAIRDNFQRDWTTLRQKAKCATDTYTVAKASPRIRSAAVKSMLFDEFTAAFLGSRAAMGAAPELKVFPTPAIGGVPVLTTVFPGLDHRAQPVGICITRGNERVGLLTVDRAGFVRRATPPDAGAQGATPVQGVPAGCAAWASLQLDGLRAPAPAPAR